MSKNGTPLQDRAYTPSTPRYGSSPRMPSLSPYAPFGQKQLYSPGLFVSTKQVKERKEEGREQEPKHTETRLGQSNPKTAPKTQSQIETPSQTGGDYIQTEEEEEAQAEEDEGFDFADEEVDMLQTTNAVQQTATQRFTLMRNPAIPTGIARNSSASNLRGVSGFLLGDAPTHKTTRPPLIQSCNRNQQLVAFFCRTGLSLLGLPSDEEHMPCLERSRTHNLGITVVDTSADKNASQTPPKSKSKRAKKAAMTGKRKLMDTTTTTIADPAITESSKASEASKIHKLMAVAQPLSSSSSSLLDD